MNESATPQPDRQEFPFAAKITVPRKALRTIMEVGDRFAEPDVDILSYHDPATSDLTDVWICFDAGGRQFGIWRATGLLYEADEHGAMGEDPIDPETLEPLVGEWPTREEQASEGG